jgi:hypothetical protein
MILGYVRISLGYLLGILFIKDVSGIFLTYPIFVNSNRGRGRGGGRGRRGFRDDSGQKENVKQQG